MPDWCEAGRRAKFGGRWRQPCNIPESDVEHSHIIGSPGPLLPIVLCDFHFEQALRLGYISEPFLSEDEYKARGGRLPK